MEMRSKQVRSGLQKKASVTEAIYEAGFGSSSRFYEYAKAVLGMKPSEYRQGAAGVDIRHAVAIPCHRVVRRNGRLGGYRWGTERKRAMLAREAGLHKSTFDAKIECNTEKGWAPPPG